MFRIHLVKKNPTGKYAQEDAQVNQFVAAVCVNVVVQVVFLEHDSFDIPHHFNTIYV